jgi:very-short-patch-repair endonuclease
VPGRTVKWKDKQGAKKLPGQHVKAALLDARRELIDLSRRNRLLHAPRTGKRPHCLEIVGAEPDELFAGLARQGKQFGLAPAAEDGVSPEETEKRRVTVLQTKLAREPLERRLLKLFREARIFEEEQGVNILFLAIGFLNWFEDARSEERCSAPLLLVPISLERRQGRDTFVMRARDDDMMVNVSLAEKLRGAFAIALPDLPEGDEWLPSTYFDLIRRAIAGQKRWDVDGIGIGLGFFTFSKFLMWRDLDAGAWPNAHTLLENALVAHLLGEGSAATPDPPLASDDEPIDRHIDLASAIHVVDADSSQALCIEEARRGRNLVVQGPPGTGKSQTIANVIAAAAHDGKTVLFVAEKAAALDVVHSRLKAVSLEPLCLEIHSKKATKLSVIESLERSIRTGSASQVDGRTASELRVARDRLNEWSEALHRQIRRSGRTPYQVMGAVLKLHADQVRVLGQRLDLVADWDRDRLQEAERSAERAASAVRKLGIVPLRHPWYGALAGRLTPFDTDRLTVAVREARQRLDDLVSVVDEAGVLLHTERDVPCAALKNLIAALRLLGRAPGDGRDALAHPAWRLERERIGKLVEHCKVWSSSNLELADRVVASSWTFDLGPVRHAIASHGSSLLRIFVRTYRQAVADLRGLCRERPPRRREDRLTLLDKLIAAQAARRHIEDEGEFGRAILGPIWAFETTPPNVIEALLAWANEAAAYRSPTIELATIASSVDAASCIVLADTVETALTALRNAVTKVTDIVRPHAADAFGLEQARLAVVADKLDRWALAVDDFNEWVGARDGLDALRLLGLEPIGEGLNNGTVDPAEAKPMTDLLIAEALWHAARSDQPILDQIDGSYRSETVGQFRDLDRKRVHLARSEVLAHYFERKPGGEVGEMAIVRNETGKKRRHLPIRKLMESAGSAIQRLKPIFLMSPMSVAQFLPAGRLTFDIVVIDEASQVPPEEALGVLARARQMVVVGDHKQLPPTNFFRMVSADDDEDGDETVTPSARTRDFESILTLAAARGIAERMLRWHYRSRHPSLIALSNHTCYGGGLLLPPSPLLKADQLGLSLIKTPRGHYDRGGSGRNPVEAEVIAVAVEKHLSNRPDLSLGVACFSVAQRDAIEDALQARGVLAAAEGFVPKGERLFIKNLEAVQGDERDTIFISIGYGPDAHGHMTAGFGPLSADGGERRLNVLISRARLQCVVYSSITAGDIPADAKPRGTRMLREFLHYAETGHIAAGQVGRADFDSPFEEAVAMAIRRGGYEAIPQVGVSGFRVDLGVLHTQKPGRFVLGVECDGAAYHSGRSARDRDRLRQQVLEGLGWKLYRIWSTDWFRNPNRQTERLLAAIEQASAGEGPPDDPPASSGKEPDDDSGESAPYNPEPTERIAPSKPLLSEPYEECRLRIARGADILTIGGHELAKLATTVVHHEGPIHVDEVARRVREAFGLERTGARIFDLINDALKRAAREGGVVRQKDFWSPKSSILRAPRSRREAALPLRRADRIAPAEYRLAITAVLRSCVAASSPELTVEVARVLGFDRTGNGLERAISDQIKEMIRDDAILEKEGRLHLQHPDVSHLL